MATTLFGIISVSRLFSVVGVATATAVTTAGVVRLYMLNLAKDAYLTQYPEDTELQNPEWDAFRHAYTSARVAQFFGFEAAILLGDANEIEAISDADKKHDFFNNDKALELWGMEDGFGDFSDIDTELAENIKAALINEDLKVLPEDVPGEFEHQSIFEGVPDITMQEKADGMIQAIASLGSGLDGLSPSVLATYLEGASTRFGAALTRKDPLAVDLNDDGVITTLAADSVYFDIDNDGVKEAVSWIGAGEGWIARDVNANGVIDSASELFGDATVDGFTALAGLDSNSDGKIDFNDTAYDELLVWRDLNSDGVSQSNELLSLASDLFIREINLGHSNNVGTAEAAIGTLRVENMILDVNETNTTATLNPANGFNFAIFALPELRGYGQVGNLSIAMNDDEDLFNDASALSSQPLDDVFTNFSDWRGDFTNMMYRWAGVLSVSTTSRGAFMDDARKLELLEEFLGTEFRQVQGGGSNPLSLAAHDLMGNFDEVRDAMIARFLLQMGGDALFANSVSFDRLGDNIVIDGAPVFDAAALDALGTAGASAADKSVYWQGIAYFIDNTLGGFSALSGTELAKLDTAVALSDNTLDWQDIVDDYIASFNTIEITGACARMRTIARPTQRAAQRRTARTITAADYHRHASLAARGRLESSKFNLETTHVA